MTEHKAIKKQLHALRDNDELRAAIHVVEKLQSNGHTAYFAGGCVRDMLLGRPVSDFDVATSAEPEAVRKLFRRTLAVGAKFGIIVVRHRGQSIEVATFRTDGKYLDGRRPERVIFSSPEEDAQRRDFTINGLFLDPITATVFDFVGGQSDLWAGKISAIGTAQDRISEDYLRLLRAVRFASRFGFAIDEPTHDAVLENAPNIKNVSAERIREELDKMFKGAGRRQALELLLETHLLEALDLPIYVSLEGRREETLRQFELLPSKCPTAVCWAIVCDLERYADRWLLALKSSNELREQCLAILRTRARYLNYSQQRLADRKRLLRLPNSDMHRLYVWSHQLSRDGDLAEITHAYEEYERFGSNGDGSLHQKPLVTGSDLISLGLSPSPQFKELLELAETWQLEDSLTKPELLERLKPHLP